MSRWPLDDHEEEHAINAALEAARASGTLRVYNDLDTLFRITEHYVDPGTARPKVLENFVPAPDDLFCLGFTPPTEHLHRGRWYAAVIRSGDRSGLAIIVVVEEETYREIVKGLKT